MTHVINILLTMAHFCRDDCSCTLLVYLARVSLCSSVIFLQRAPWLTHTMSCIADPPIMNHLFADDSCL